MIQAYDVHRDQRDVSIARFIWDRAKASPQRPALTFRGHTQSYDELCSRIQRLAQCLLDGGIKAGARVAYAGKNSAAFLETYFATSSIGAIFVPMNFRLTGGELAYILDDCEVHTLIADADCSIVLDAVRSELVCSRFISWGTEKANWERYESLVQSPCRLTTRYGSQPEDVALIMYTSGTTGRPKGAMLTNGNLFWNNLNIQLAGNMLVRDVSLTCGPLFHVGGLNVTTSLSFMLGAHTVLHETFDPGAIIADVGQFGVRTMWGAPAMFQAISEHESFEAADLSSLDLLICGGAPVPKVLIQQYAKRGISLCQGYGLTETSSFAAFLPTHLLEHKMGSAGTAPMFGELAVRLDDGAYAQPGQSGEVCVRGPMVFQGYWNRPDETSQAYDAEGWFHTGDVGYLDTDGYLFLNDRIKDVVISGGENVYPSEVENVLLSHPSIAQVAVIGLPHPKWGECVTAVVVLRPGGDVTLEALRDFAGSQLARFKLPLRLEIVPELPRNPAGKVLKYQLRESFRD